MTASFVIDVLDFIRNAGIHRGKTLPGDFERLQSYLFDDKGELLFVVNGLLDKVGRPMLQLLVKGKINLCCQRCLGKLEQPIDQQLDLLLVKNEADLHQYDNEDAMDTLLIVPDMDVMLLIEDEIILNLPISPCHSQSKCSEKSLICSNEKPYQDVPEHPFAALAAFKKLH